jgi:hypothetical protein
MNPSDYTFEQSALNSIKTLIQSVVGEDTTLYW